MNYRNNRQKSRTAKDPRLDLIRCVACFFVVAVHFFGYTNFERIPIDSWRMYSFTFIRCFLLICVPLFILLTGYLMNQKTLSPGYYLSLIKTLTIYILASFFCFFAENLFWNPKLTLFTTIRKLFSFQAAPYAWYIEMYIGLFLLIPFLNPVYHTLRTKQEKQWLILTLFTLTAIPQILNCFPLLAPTWWRPPVPSDNYVQLAPAYWTSLYPLTYYFIGCYIREYRPSIQPWKGVILMLLWNGLFSGFCIYRSYPNTLADGQWASYGSVFVVVLAVLFFCFLLNLPIRFGKICAKILRIVSDCCLGAYLLSYIFDTLFYQWLWKITDDAPLQFRYYLPVVLAIFTCSIGLSFILNQIYSLIQKISSAIIQHREAVPKGGKQP